MIKKFLFSIVLFYFLSINNFAFSEIIPLKKPIQSKEETQKKLLTDILKPLPKPTKETDKKAVEENIVVKKEKKTTKSLKATQSQDFRYNG